MKLPTTTKEAKDLLQNWEMLFYAERFEVGIKLFQAAKAIFNRNGDEKSYIEATYRLAHFYINGNKTNIDKAKTELEEALQLAKKRKVSASKELINIYNILSNYHNYNYDIIPAFESVEKALHICKELYGEKNNTIAGLYKTVANIHMRSRTHDQAIFYYNKALAIYKENSEEYFFDIAYTYNQIGIEYGLNGNIGLSKSYLHKALQFYLQTLGNKHIRISKTYTNLGVNAALMGQLTKAKDYMEKAFNSLIDLEENEREMAAVTLNLGALCERKQEYEEAQKWLEQSLDLVLNFIGEISRIGLDVYYLLGLVANHQKNHLQAKRYALKSLQVGVQLIAEYHPLLSKIYVLLGNIFLTSKDLDKGISYFQKALMCLFPDFKPKSEYDSPSISNKSYDTTLVESLNNKARGLWSRYSKQKQLQDLQAAADTYDLALNLIDLIRQGYESEDSKMALLNDGNIALVYEGIIDTNLEQYNLSKNKKYLNNAFKAVEKSRANILLGQLKDVSAKFLANIPKDLLQKESDLKAKLTQLNNKIQILQSLPKPDEYKISQLRGQYFDDEQAYQKLILQFETDYPQYYQLKHQVETVTIDVLQKKIPINTALVEYFIGEKHLYTFVITSNDTQFLQSAKPDDFEELIEAFKTSIDEIDKSEYLELAFELHELLIAPITNNNSPITSSQSPVTNLKIIPSGILSTIPFEALLTEEVNGNTKYADLPYLLLQYDISYHYSATLWSQNIDTESIETYPTFVGFAPVYKSEQKQTFEEAAKRSLYNNESTRSVRIGEETYSELIHSEEEVNSIQSYFNAKNIPTQTFLHAQANSNNFLQNVGKHKYVLISAHGFYNEKQPDLTGIILSPSINQTLANPSDVAKSLTAEKKASIRAKNSPSSELPLWRGQGEVNGDVSSESENKNIFYLSDAYNLELNADLVVLSCCETGVGKLAKGEGVMALNRGFFYAGAKNVIYTLFKVYDQASCQLTQHLFQHILEQKDYSSALKEAKRQLISQGKAPIHWAGYLLIGE